MIPRHEPFPANSAAVSGTVTRFAIVDCKLDFGRMVAMLRLALDWVLRERTTVPDAADAMATAWGATFYKSDNAGRIAPVAVVVVSAADVVAEAQDAEGRQFRFHVEVEFELSLDEPPPRLEATIRRIEDKIRSPVGDMLGFANAPDLDLDPDRPFAAKAARWFQHGSIFAGSNPDLCFDIVASDPPVNESLQQQAPMEPAQQALASLPAAHRDVSTCAADAREAPQTEPVDAAVFCPPTVGRATPFLVQAFLYPPAQAEVAREQAHEADAGAERRGVLSLPLDVPRGTRIDLRLEMPRLTVDEPDAVVIWRGAMATAQFDVAVPADAVLGTTIGRIRFAIAGVPAGTLRFQVTVAAVRACEAAHVAEITVRRYRRAFVSYSSKDRAEVLRRVQAFRIAGLSVFQDVLDLEPGDRWERELYREIDNCDVVLLFWSQAAAASPWVAKEIDYALALKQGEDDRPPDIAPVPIEGPPIPTPPLKLRHLHFNDALLAQIAAAQATH